MKKKRKYVKSGKYSKLSRNFVVDKGGVRMLPKKPGPKFKVGDAVKCGVNGKYYVIRRISRAAGDVPGTTQTTG